MPETAMAPTRVVLNRSIAGSMTFTFQLSGGLMSVVCSLTVWFQAAKDDSAMRRCQHHPISPVSGHHEHRCCHLYGEGWLLCSGNAAFPSPLLDWLPGSL